MKHNKYQKLSRQAFECIQEKNMSLESWSFEKRGKYYNGRERGKAMSLKLRQLTKFAPQLAERIDTLMNKAF